MKEVMYNDYAKQLLETLPKGVFLNVSDGTRDNTMTIGWGSLGVIWSKPVLMVMVRGSRYTYDIIEKTDCFSVSVPLQVDLKKALGFCGSKSGRDHDKWIEAGLTKLPGQKVDAPLIGECELHYECQIIGRQKLTKEVLLPGIEQSCYASGDYHTLYYGEIVGVYLK